LVNGVNTVLSEDFDYIFLVNEPSFFIDFDSESYSNFFDFNDYGEDFTDEGVGYRENAYLDLNSSDKNYDYGEGYSED
jgi:hypothetical protein